MLISGVMEFKVQLIVYIQRLNDRNSTTSLIGDAWLYINRAFSFVSSSSFFFFFFGGGGEGVWAYLFVFNLVLF